MFSAVKDDPDAVRDFWVVYEANEDIVWNAMMVMLRTHPVFGPMTKHFTDAQHDARNSLARAQIRDAFLKGAWEPYAAALREQGTAYARLNIPFASWFDVVTTVQKVLVPPLVRAYIGEPDRLSRVMCMMSEFLEHRVSLIAERYVASREEDRFHVLVDAVKDYAVIMLDAEARVTSWNVGAEALTGWVPNEVLGKTIDGFFPLGDRVTNGVLDEEDWCTRKGGTRFWAHVTLRAIDRGEGVVGFAAVVHDLTERKRANEDLEQRVASRTAALRESEERLRQSQKMEAVGRLAGGIAHDFNNLLSVILSYSELLSADLAGEHHGELQEIRGAGNRAADLTRQLLAFSRQQVLTPKITDLNQVIMGMNKMLSRLIGEDIEMRTVTAPDLGNVMVDPNQIEQVVMNLVVNARDAMPKGGTLLLETANVGQGEGARVMLAVTDSGVGMDKTTALRIFEPFFTTKEMGKGTGLGLSTVFGIVNQSGGEIVVESEIGRGTTFRIEFPVTASQPRGDSSRTVKAMPTGKETILLVEDEEQVRRLVKTVLSRLGYSVLDAPDGPRALDVAADHAGAIDLLVTDVIMPKMSGRELAEKLAPLRPKTKVLFMSGYTNDEVLRHGVVDLEFAFLQKPVTPEAIALAVRNVLDVTSR